MSRVRTLEDRYRRPLALSPAEYRAVHGEEMLGVLMMAADPGQRRPGGAESAALIGGAVRIRLRPGRAALHQYWQDALAPGPSATLARSIPWAPSRRRSGESRSHVVYSPGTLGGYGRPVTSAGAYRRSTSVN